MHIPNATPMNITPPITIGRLSLTSHLKIAYTCAHVWHTTITKIIKQGLDENTSKVTPNGIQAREYEFYMDPNKPIKSYIIIKEYGFYMNPNNSKKPNNMKSLN